MGEYSTISKKYSKKNIFISVLVTVFVLASNIFATATFFPDGKSADRSDEWFDGNFTGKWEKKDSTSGDIWGDINLGRSSNVGEFLGKFNTYDNSSSGTLIGKFHNKILRGKITSDGEQETSRFFGFLNFEMTGFKAAIFGLKIGFMSISGEYEASFLPSLTGLYGVGTKDLHLIDESRLEEFTTEDPDDFREMMIRIWYPIDKEIEEPRIEYMDEPTFAWLMGRSPVPLITIPDNAYQFVRPHGKNEVPISDEEEMYPVIIFSPGYDGVYQIYTSLIEDIVSGGFIVVSINHPYISGITVFPDGRKVYTAQNSSGDLGIRSVVEDAKFVLDNITEMNVSDPDFSGKFDLSKVGMYGHSFGGASTSICCYEDERFLCGLTLDGVFYIDYIPDGIYKPFMLLIAENRFNSQNVIDMWEHLFGDSYLVEIEGSTHYAFTDVGILLNHLVPLIPPKILGFGTIEPKRMINITRIFELMFFEVYLKDRPKQDLIDLGSFFEDVKFEYK
ncbi:hypothetical protein AYK21_03370 [Thermoplasmatales archaeon SG8-52-2]|nr:MAG: hypothetical protein AYK21_03370 [Thermoplasmatales archaeon SG8-52-2]